MEVRTDAAIINNHSAILNKIAHFWDNISSGWKEILGSHIHHGFYDANEQRQVSVLSAQEKLIEKLANLLNLKKQDRVLDVGCGMGGSAIYLAKQYQVQVIGITLSQKQVDIARASLQEKENPGPMMLVTFLKEDAHTLANFTDNSMDVIWSLESCEQFYDKTLFIQQAHRVLKPGGQLMIATWCSDQDAYHGALAKNYLTLCKQFDLPYMPSLSWYTKVIASFFQINRVEDWSDKVKDSWDIGLSLLKNYSFWHLLKHGGLTSIRFVMSLKRMSRSFQEGQLRYGVFLATKP